MMRILVILIGVLAVTSTVEAEKLPTVAEITRKLDELYRSKSSVASMTMSVSTRHFSRTLSIDAWSISDTHSLMVIRNPAREKGTATLRTPKGLWNYAPRADRLMRIPSAMLSDGWMGSHVTNDDLMRESSWEKDYKTTLKWADGGKTVVASMIPRKDAAIVYSKVIMKFSAADYMPVSAEYYDGKDVVRTWTWSDIRTMGGRKIPAVIRIVPSDKPKESTVLTYKKLVFDGAVDKSLFTPRGLKRAARR